MPASDRGQTFRLAALSLIGVGVGSSAFFFGFYDATTWEPMLLVGLVFLLGFVVARPSVPTGTAAVAAGGLFALGGWSLASTQWSGASDLAVTDAARWLLYGVLLLLLLYLVRDSKSRKWLIGSATAGVLLMALYLQVRLLTDSGAATDLFVSNRLNSPLEYINGVATYLLAGFWPLVAVAERARNQLVRGLATFGAVQLVVLAVLTQSRGAIVAIVASTVLVLAIVPGRVTRAWILVVICIGLGICGPALIDVVNSGKQIPSGDSIQTVAWMSLLGGLASGLLVAIASWFSARMERDSPQTGDRLKIVSSVTVIAVCALGLGAATVMAASRSDQIRDQLDSFTNLEATDGGSRLTSGGGNRYDYWRVALKQLEDDPLTGIGAGNYKQTYYLERKTSEDVQQAHSIELQTLGELGVVGGVALLAIIGAVLSGFWLTARGSSRSTRSDPALAVAAGGTFFVWFFHTSVDWMHLLPGLTGIAICAAAVLLPTLRPVPGRYSLAVVATVAVLVVAVSFPVLKQLRSLQLQEQAVEKLDSDPVAALKDAQASIGLEPSQRSYYMESAAFARLGLFGPARDSLLDATRNDRRDFVAWGLLGDLATRRGLGADARQYYRRALQLNPRDPGLASLVKEPTETP